MQLSFIDLLFTIDFMFAFNFEVSKLLLFIVCIKPSIENGKLIEEGTHEQLKNEKGLYSQFCKKQSLD